MNSFDPIEQGLAITRLRYPVFPSSAVILARLVRHISLHLADYAAAVLRPWSINFSEYTVLMALYGAEGYMLKMATLRKVAGEKQSHVSRAIKQLCGNGLIQRERDKLDRRKDMLTLTLEGKAMIERFLPVISEMMERQVQSFAEAERKALEQLLKRFLDELERV